jgi:hypothetical protein
VSPRATKTFSAAGAVPRSACRSSATHALRGASGRRPRSADHFEMKAGDLAHVSAVGFTELPQHLALLHPCEPPIHDHDKGEHGQRST